MASYLRIKHKSIILDGDMQDKQLGVEYRKRYIEHLN